MDSNFQIQNGKLMKYTGEETEVTIPSGVTSIAGSAFWFCPHPIKK